jgi:hypothetical protein
VPTQLCTDPGLLPRAKLAQPRSCTSAADGRDPPASPLSSVTASAPQRSHLCARTLEPSHRSLVPCDITLALPLLALSPSLRQPGMLRQELDDETLE